MPTPALRAMSSSGASAPFSAKAAVAASRSLARLRRASARIFGSWPASPCSVTLSPASLRALSVMSIGLRTLSGLQNGGFLRIVTGVNLRIFPHRTSRLAGRGADVRDTRDRRPGTRPGVALAIMLGAQLMIILDATVVNIALPHIQTGLHFSATSLSWVMNGYTLTFGGLLLLGGRAGDILGRRRMFLAGIAIFTIASLAGGLATSAGLLLAARAVQGVGGALASPAVLALVVSGFPEGKERIRALAIYSAVVTGGSSLGLVLG